MKKISVLFFCLISGWFAFANAGEVEVSSKIDEVTVFRQGAQVERTARVSIPAGASAIKFTGISPNIDPLSIQVSATGAFTILSVVHQLNFFEEPVENEQVLEWRQQLEELEDLLKEDLAFLELFSQEEKMILANQSLGGQQQGPAVEDLQRMSAYYQQRLREIKLEKLKLEKSVEQRNEEIVKIKQQIQTQQSGRKKESTSEILVSVSASAATGSDFRLSYLVTSAAWRPLYDIRVKDVESPVSLMYNAHVRQSSGEDWTGVKLTLSTGNPSRGGLRPTLHPWRLDLYQVAKPDWHRNRTDALASEEMEAAELKEAPPAAPPLASRPEVEQVETTTAVEFRIEVPYDIPADNKDYLVGMEEHELPASFEYYAAPKLDKDAFLTARVTNWEQYYLLSGKANLFFEGTYLGQSYLNVAEVSDTMIFSLGRDQGIVVSRTKDQDYRDRQFVGNKKTETIGWEIELRNKKRQEVTIVIEDQIPLSLTDEIEVKLENADGADFDENTGLLRWKLKLKPGESQKLNFRYAVKYPKKEVVVLE